MTGRFPTLLEKMMIRGGLCIIVIALLALTPAVFAASITHTYTFNTPAIQIENGNALILLDGAHSWAPVGEPLLPTQAVQLLLPPGEEAVSISVRTGDPVLLGSGIQVMPAQQPQPISMLDPALVTDHNVEIYSSDDLYPAELTGNLRTDFLCGHGIASGLVFPVQYYPQSGEVYYFPEMTVTISTQPSVQAIQAHAELLQRSEAVQKRVTGLVQNPQANASYGPEMPMDLDIWDLLVITTSSLMPYYDDFINDKNLRNISTTSITTEEIYATYSGNDNQDKIRNCITDLYMNHALQYVLLAGDTQQIGCRKFYVEAGSYSAYIPSDLYYGGLDGNWNTDGDNYWGEYNEADFFAEVMVGRNCADDLVEAVNFCTKTMMFETDPVVSELLTGLMVGEDMGWAAWGSEYKEEIHQGSSLYNYTTVGFPETFSVDTLYDNASYSWSAMNTLRPMLNEGPQLMNHLGHANWDYVMKFYRDQITDNNFSNNGINHNFFIGYSQGCIAGNFEKNNPDCIVEEFTTIGHAAVAFVANSKYGWGVSYGTNGPSQRFDREFFDAIFGEDITVIGRTNDDSKTDNIAWVGDPYYRWCYYELNLFGDPTLEIWTELPGSFEAEIDDFVLTGSTEITVNNILMLDATVVVAMDGQVLGQGQSTFMGNAVVELDEPIASAGILDIAVTKENILPWYGQ
ncbi:hypothetical protein KKA08_03910, partial [bacterium]|nr:hypothetical protein [bacterium]